MWKFPLGTFASVPQLFNLKTSARVSLVPLDLIIRCCFFFLCFNNFRCNRTYESIENGNILDALTDLTGAICEYFTPDVNPPHNLFRLLHISCFNRSLIVCWRSEKRLTPIGFIVYQPASVCWHFSLFSLLVLFSSQSLSDLSSAVSIILFAINLFMPTRNQMGSSRCNVGRELLRLLWQPQVTINGTSTQKQSCAKIMTHVHWLHFSDAY